MLRYPAWLPVVKSRYRAWTRGPGFREFKDHPEVPQFRLSVGVVSLENQFHHNTGYQYQNLNRVSYEVDTLGANAAVVKRGIVGDGLWVMDCG
ncbi:MAG: hypothetical protein IT168_10980 [Bryobacterales bacterium]|nr:hypothetical protein [Bryobacterales bacterium]